MAEDIDHMATAQALVGQMMTNRKNQFLLTWEGTRTPSGAE